MNESLKILTVEDEDRPESTTMGGNITTDFSQLYTLLANRVSALEVALDKLNRPEPSPTNPDPQPVEEAPAPVEEVKEEETESTETETTEKETE